MHVNEMLCRVDNYLRMRNYIYGIGNTIGTLWETKFNKCHDWTHKTIVRIIKRRKNRSLEIQYESETEISFTMILSITIYYRYDSRHEDIIENLHEISIYLDIILNHHPI